MANTHNWIFHKNDYTGSWHAVKAEDYFLLKNDINNPKVLAAEYIEDLESLINKTDGDPSEIKKLLKHGRKQRVGTQRKRVQTQVGS